MRAEKRQTEGNSRLKEFPLARLGRLSTKWTFQVGVLFLWVLAFGLFGCSTGPPPPAAAKPSSKTLTFQVSFNNITSLSTQFSTSAGNTYLGFYRIVLNTLNTGLIGNQFAITTSPDTWTDYFELNSTGWIRNHRIAPPSSQQPQQWTGNQAITPGTISSSNNSFTLVVSLPDQYLGTAGKFNASIITFIAQASSPGILYPIDALGPPVSTNSSIDFLTFDTSVSSTNNKSDSLNDWTTYARFPDITVANYQNFDVQSLTVSEQQ